jgi:hypothetical protein
MPSDVHENAGHSSAINSSKAYFFVPWAPPRSRLRRDGWPLAWPSVTVIVELIPRAANTRDQDAIVLERIALTELRLGQRR